MIAFHEAVEAAPAQTKLDYYRMIYVLEQIEGGSANSYGGKLCWTKAAWKEETKMPFSFAQQDAASHLYAYKRLVRLGAILMENDLPVSPYTLACLWHHGLDGTLRLVRAGEGSDYGLRATALYFCK